MNSYTDPIVENKIKLGHAKFMHDSKRLVSNKAKSFKIRSSNKQSNSILNKDRREQ